MGESHSMATSSLPSAFDAHSHPHILPPMFYSAIQDYPPGFCRFNPILQQQSSHHVSSETCDDNELSERKAGKTKADNSVEESGDEEIVHEKRMIFQVVHDYPPGFGPNQPIMTADSQNSECCEDHYDGDDEGGREIKAMVRDMNGEEEEARIRKQLLLERRIHFAIPDYPPGFGPYINSKHYGFDYTKLSPIYECSEDDYNGDDEKEVGKVCRKRKSSDLKEEGGDEFVPKRMMCFEVCHYPAGFSPCRLLHQHDFEPSDFYGDGDKTNISSSLLLL